MEGSCLINKTIIEYVLSLYLIIILIKFSKQDLRNKHIQNKYFFLPFCVGILKNLIYYLIIYNINQVILNLFFFTLIIIFNCILYYYNLLGGADFKTNIIIFLIYSPINTSGLTDVYDIYQFLILFSIFYIIIPWLNLIHNFISFNRRINMFNISSKNYKIMPFLLVTHIKKITKITNYDRIVTNYPGNFLQGPVVHLKFGLYFHVKSHYCILPVITVIFLIILII